MTTLFRTVLAVALLMLALIGLDAALDPWPGTVEPRALKPVRWIVDRFADRPLGLAGSTFWLLAAAGSSLLWYASARIGRRREPGSEARAEPRPIAAGEPSATTPGRRRLAPHLAAGAAPADAAPPVDFATLFGLDKAIEPSPAWRLEVTSPDQASSWLGGTPFASQAFDWPAAADGRPMLFVAQIDLADISAPGLPADGALLVFVGVPGDQGWEYRVRLVARDDVLGDAPNDPPAGAVTPHEVGWFQAAGALLQPTPVRLEAYHDADSDRPVSKLFGVEVQDAYGFPYPDGFRNLLYIEHHQRLGTASEHWQGMSIACPAADLDRGELNTGRIFGTHNG